MKVCCCTTILALVIASTVNAQCIGPNVVSDFELPAGGTDYRLATDGDLSTHWNALRLPPASFTISHIDGLREFGCLRLITEQSQPSHTRHYVIVSTWASGEVWFEILDGYTQSGDTLEIDLRSTTDVRTIEIRTLESTSWVAWKEVELYETSPIATRSSTWGRMKALFD